MTVTDIRVPASRRAPVRKWSWFTYMAVILGPALVGVLIGYIGRRAQEPASGGELVQPVALATVTAKAFPDTQLNWVGAGTFTVPAQAAPGTYILTATGNTFGCSWERLKADDGKPKSVIDSGTVTRGGFSQFTVDSGDKLLKLLGDCTWARQ